MQAECRNGNKVACNTPVKNSVPQLAQVNTVDKEPGLRLSESFVTQLNLYPQA